MTRARTIALGLALFCGVTIASDPRVARACGYTPWADQSEDEASAVRTLMTGARLPLLSPSWHSEFWVIAWARVEGATFSDASVLALSSNPGWLRASSDAREAPERWTAARSAVGAPSGPRPRAYQRGPNYASTLVCPPDMFRTAVQTLADRDDAGADPVELQRFVEGQDAVFARCESPDAPLPAELSASAGTRAVEDRAYQRAQAMALGTDWRQAIRAFEAIAASASSWGDLALYRAAALRVRAGEIDVPNLEARRAQVQDPKARRALRQLIDRVDLFTRPAAEVVEVLGDRVRTEDLALDLPRTLRDIVHFAKRVPPDEPCVSGLVGMITGRPTCEGRAHVLAALRHRAHEPAPAQLALPGTLLELNRLFHSGRRAVYEGRNAVARRTAARMRRRSSDSTASTRNAARTLALAARGGQMRRPSDIIRESARGDTVHADGYAALGRATTASWRRWLDDLPEEAASSVRVDGLLRGMLLDSQSDVEFFAHALVMQTPGSDSFEQSVSLAVAESGEERYVGLVRAFFRHQPGSAMISDEMSTHYGSLPQTGCRFGSCGDSTPAQGAVGRIETSEEGREVSSRQRERIAALGSRLDALGEWTLAFAHRHEGDERAGELLHLFVNATRSASIHYAATPATGILSRRAFAFLHERMADSHWADETPYWYR